MDIKMNLNLTFCSKFAPVLMSDFGCPMKGPLALCRYSQRACRCFNQNFHYEPHTASTYGAG